MKWGEMMNWKSILGSLKYAPIIMNAVKQVSNRYAPPPPPPLPTNNDEVTNMMAKLVKINEELAEEVAKQKERITYLEQDYQALRLIVWIGGGGLCVLTLIMVIVTLMALGSR